MSNSKQNYNLLDFLKPLTPDFSRSKSNKSLANKETKSNNANQRVLIQTNSNKQLNSQQEVKQNIVIINIYFDGTKNNLYNIDDYKTYKMTRAKVRVVSKIPTYGGAYESYTNAYSNIAHLFKGSIDNKQNHGSIYIEGMGSSKGNQDDTQGFALGSGNTGIKIRALSAFPKIAEKIKDFNPKATMVMLNVFGFSRGAATARHFVNLLHTDKSLSKDWGIRPGLVFVNFLGLFDTVSSFDDSFAIGMNWETISKAWDVVVEGNQGINFNDVDELGLKITSIKQARRVFHICAEDEYRLFFSLTNIKSSLNGFGYEVSLPGAHSDIGGSYHDGREDIYFIRDDDKTLENWFKNKGIFTDIGYNPLKNVIKKTCYRKSVSNHAFKISLRTMRLMAIEEGNLKIKDSYFEDAERSDRISNLISTVSEKIIKEPNRFSLGTTKSFSYLYNDTKIYVEGLKDFRNKYVHWSAKNETGYELRRGDLYKDDDVAYLKYAIGGKDIQFEPYRVQHTG